MWRIFANPRVYEREGDDDESIRQRCAFDCISSQRVDYLLGVRLSLHCYAAVSHRTTRTTLRELEAKETWKPMDGEAVEEFKKTSPFRDAEFGGKELVRDVTHVIKVR